MSNESFLYLDIGRKQLIVRVDPRMRIVAGGLTPAAEFDPDTILVVSAPNRTFVPVVQHVAGLITGERARNSHAATPAIEYDIPAIAGVQNTLDILPVVQDLALDATRGMIYEGRAAVT
ncbi:MAG: PEP-utilizing enzyme [Ardenticatenaceae bacterium]|nr:PEP-utilizing enzyme [Ardenticatenaceae bacterium]